MTAIPMDNLSNNGSIVFEFDNVGPDPEEIKDEAGKLAGPVLTLSDFDHLRVTMEKNIPKSIPTITIGGAAIAAPKNITGIAAPPKGGKTAIHNVLVAGAFSKTGEIDYFPDIKVSPNTLNKAVISIDTEQDFEDQQYNITTHLNAVGHQVTPNCHRAYNIRSLSLSQFRETTDNICMLCAKEFGGIHLIVIDGGADFVTSVNDEAQAREIIEYFTHLSITYECAVVVIVHQNPNSDKERGHVGSELQRKCYGLLSLSRVGDIFTLTVKMGRRAGSGDSTIINFTYNKEAGHHMQVDADCQEDSKAIKARKKLEALAPEVFSLLASYTQTEAYQAIMRHTSKGRTTAKDYLNGMLDYGIISKSDTDGRYRLTG